MLLLTRKSALFLSLCSFDPRATIFGRESKIFVDTQKDDVVVVVFVVVVVVFVVVVVVVVRRASEFRVVLRSRFKFPWLRLIGFVYF